MRDYDIHAWFSRGLAERLIMSSNIMITGAIDINIVAKSTNKPPEYISSISWLHKLTGINDYMINRQVHVYLREELKSHVWNKIGRSF